MSNRSSIVQPKTTILTLPLSIGLEGHNGKFIPIFSKGTVLPIKANKQFGCAEGQKQILIKVYEVGFHSKIEITND